MKKIGYGYEFSVGNGGIFYPAYLDRRCLNKLAARILVRFRLHSEFEIKVRRDESNKGLSWRIITFMSDDPSVENRCYTFCIDDTWRVVKYLDHWKSGSITPRCQSDPEFEKELNKLVDAYKEELPTYYTNVEKPFNHRYLVGDDFHIILSDNDSRDRSFVILDF